MADKQPTEKQTTDIQPVEIQRPSRQWIIGIIAIIVVAYVILIAGGLWVFRSAAHNASEGQQGFHVQQRFTRPYFATNDQTYTVSQSTSDGLTTTTTNKTYTQTQGVVTTVNKDSIVVAGGGKAQTIKTNGDTTYVGDTKPAVNDTVVVVGTKDGDTITATQVDVYN